MVWTRSKTILVLGEQGTWARLGSYGQVGSAEAAKTDTDWRSELMQRRGNMFLFGSGSARLDRVECH
jgi:hypothetical protein